MRSQNVLYLKSKLINETYFVLLISSMFSDKYMYVCSRVQHRFGGIRDKA